MNTHRPHQLLRIEADLPFDRLSYCFPAEPRTTSMTHYAGRTKRERGRQAIEREAYKKKTMSQNRPRHCRQSPVCRSFGFLLFQHDVCVAARLGGSLRLLHRGRRCSSKCSKCGKCSKLDRSNCHDRFGSGGWYDDPACWRHSHGRQVPRNSVCSISDTICTSGQANTMEVALPRNEVWSSMHTTVQLPRSVAQSDNVMVQHPASAGG